MPCLFEGRAKLLLSRYRSGRSSTRAAQQELSPPSGESWKRKDDFSNRSGRSLSVPVFAGVRCVPPSDFSVCHKNVGGLPNQIK